MISVVIPLMAIPPYDTQIKDCLQSLFLQKGVITDIIIESHEIRDFIHKNALLNAGIAKAKGNYIWLCDADFLIADKWLLKKMRDKINEGYDVVLPKFFGARGYRAADGGIFMHRDLMKTYGGFDESIIGISGDSFFFLNWALDNCRVFCKSKYQIQLNKLPFVKRSGKKHVPSVKKTISVRKQVMKKLHKMGAWP